MVKIVCVSFVALAGCAGQMMQTESALQYKILQKGTGARASVGDEVLIYETTRYRNGTVLYSNYESTKPVKVKIGADQATRAVDEGLRGMQVGEVRELIAPPHLVKRKAYPPNVSRDSTLIIKMKLDQILAK